MRTQRLVAATITAIASTGLVVWLLWGSLLRDTGLGGLASSVKDYALIDQLAYMAVARNVTAGLPSFFVEPFAASGESITPSGYFWLLGLVAKWSGLTIFGAWNIVGIATTLVLIGVLIWWARWVLPTHLAWCIAPLVILIGSFQWLTGTGPWSVYESHAVLAPPITIIFNPGAEPFGLALTLATFCLVGIGLTKGAAAPWYIGGGILLGLTILTHTYVAIFSVLALSLALAVFGLRQARTTFHVAALGAALLATLGVVAILPLGTALGRLLLVLLVTVTIAISIKRSRRAILRPLLVVGGTAVVISAPLLLRIARQAGEAGSFFHLRQEWASSESLGIPIASAIGQFLPVWLMAAIAAVSLWRRAAGARDTWWLASLLAFLVATPMLTFNDWWGLEQEPYRFLPLGILLLAATALPWAWLILVSGSRAFIVAAALIVALLLTIPATAMFARARPANLRLTPGAMTTYEVLGRLGGTDPILYDGCIRNDLAKVVGGGRVVGLNRGFAIPPELEETDRVLANTREGVMPTAADLRTLGIRWVVAAEDCVGFEKSELRRRFGPPRHVTLSTVQGVNEEVGPIFTIYRVP